MRNIVDPRQTPLFDPFSPVLKKRTRAKLERGWQGVFRHVLLELMPVETVAGEFSPDMGCPTKELYSMSGLLVVKEFMNWTKEEAINAYCYRMDLQYALNLAPVAQELGLRTLERYEKIFIENDLAGRVMHEVTARLAEVCEIRTDQQRLDSTHIFSNMASFGRTRMMGVTVKRFLTQLKRSDQGAYKNLPEELKERYAPSAHRMFGGMNTNEAKRQLLRQQVADDMYELIRRFADNRRHQNRSTFKMLERVFYEQCEVEEEQVCIKKKTGGDVTQNPSDPDATYDGHKGSGYQAQLSETCHPENEVQLITSAIPETAVESDTAALPKVLDDLEAQATLPESLLADATYGSDENVQEAEARGVELVSPTKAGARDTEKKNREDAFETLSIDDFSIDEETEEVLACPAGVKPESSIHDDASATTTTVMPKAACSKCEFAAQCSVRKVKDQYRVKHTPKERRLAARRREEQTEVFRERYRLRAGIEGTNSGLKRRVGLARLRVRGKARVFNAILLKVTGWNILRAGVCTKMREFVAQKAKSASCERLSAKICRLMRHHSLQNSVFNDFRRSAVAFPSVCKNRSLIQTA